MRKAYWVILILAVLAILAIFYQFKKVGFESSKKTEAGYSFDEILVFQKNGDISTSTAQTVARYINGNVIECVDGITCLINTHTTTDEDLTEVITKIEANPKFNNINVLRNFKATQFEAKMF